ncbi:MAG: hypothetical protein ACM3N0_01190 [Chloroflexota bacterium]
MFRGLPAEEFIHGSVDLGRKRSHGILMDRYGSHNEDLGARVCQLTALIGVEEIHA